MKQSDHQKLRTHTNSILIIASILWPCLGHPNRVTSTDTNDNVPSRLSPKRRRKKFYLLRPRERDEPGNPDAGLTKEQYKFQWKPYHQQWLSMRPKKPTPNLNLIMSCQARYHHRLWVSRKWMILPNMQVEVLDGRVDKQLSSKKLKWLKWLKQLRTPLNANHHEQLPYVLLKRYKPSVVLVIESFGPGNDLV